MCFSLSFNVVNTQHPQAASRRTKGIKSAKRSEADIFYYLKMFGYSAQENNIFEMNNRIEFVGAINFPLFPSPTSIIAPNSRQTLTDARRIYKE